jgi:hypothetical protein
MQDDQITDNGSVPMVIYTQDLRKNTPDRDLKEDPYSLRAGAAVSGATVRLAGNKPVFKIDGIENLVLSDLHIVSAGKVFADNIFPAEHDITSNIGSAGKAVVVSRKAKAQGEAAGE